MMTALAGAEQKQMVIANNVDRGSGPFCCRFCSAPMVYRHGMRVSAHFAHKAGFECSSDCVGVAKYGGGGEGVVHLELKTQIYRDALALKEMHPYIKGVEIEHRLGSTIADVAIIGTKRKVAIEIQISPLSWEVIATRMAEHAAHGFSTLWVLDPPEYTEMMVSGVRYPVKGFQKDIHYLSEGAIFFYDGELCFTAAHLMGYKVRTKHYKICGKKYHLFELVDHPHKYSEEDKDPWSRVVTVPEKDRWWKNYPSYYD